MGLCQKGAREAQEKPDSGGGEGEIEDVSLMCTRWE